MSFKSALEFTITKYCAEPARRGITVEVQRDPRPGPVMLRVTPQISHRSNCQKDSDRHRSGLLQNSLSGCSDAPSLNDSKAGASGAH